MSSKALEKYLCKVVDIYNIKLNSIKVRISYLHTWKVCMTKDLEIDKIEISNLKHNMKYLGEKIVTVNNTKKKIEKYYMIKIKN